MYMEEPIAWRNKYLYRLLPMRLLGVFLPLSDQLSLPKSGLSLDLGLLCGRPLLQKSPPLLADIPHSSFLLFLCFSFVRVFLSKPAVSRPICSPKALPSSCAAVLGWIKQAEKKKKQKSMKIPSCPQLRGSTNMPLFGRVYKCKEYEH